jgi:predicted deacylase
MRADAWLDALDTAAFAGSYAAARAAFAQAAVGAGAIVEGHAHPLAGPEGEPLSTDTAWLGPVDAGRVLVLQSAMHGVEGFCGSAAQTDFLKHPPRLPADTAVLAIHAINPHGFAWLRRVTEDGVDLNRNFVDFAAPLPANPGYDELHEAIVPADLAPASIAAADARLAAFATAHGREAFERALSGGQYRHPHGLFYGGTAPTWSRRTTEAIVAAHGLGQRHCVGVLDFHTGLGPFAYGEPICDHAPGSPGVARARAWYGASLTEPALGTSSSVAKFGLSDYGWQDLVGESLVYVALEFGSYDFAAMIAALRADHWLHARGAVDWQDARAQAIKAAMRRHFCPESADWRQAVLFRARQCIVQALAGLSRE